MSMQVRVGQRLSRKYRLEGFWTWGPGGNSHIKRTGVLVVPLRGLKSGFGSSYVFSLKRSTAGALVIPFRALSRKITVNTLKNYVF